MTSSVRGEAPQLRRDGRRVLVPLAGVAHERQVGRHLLAVLGEEARQRRRAAFLLALEQHGDRARGSAPATLFQARAASKKVMSWPLLSSAPRATITLPLTLSVAMRGSNGGVFHSSSGSGGCTS